MKIHLSIPVLGWAWCLRILLMHTAEAECCPQARLPDRQQIPEEYYSLLERIADDSPSEQILALQSFLQQHRTFGRAYLKLLELFQSHDRISEAEIYFQKLTHEATSRRQGYWMLAKIFICQSDSQAVSEAFARAFQASRGSPSLDLLNDFIDFNHQQSRSLDRHALLRELDLRPEFQEVFTGIFYHQQQNYAAAIAAFQRAPPEMTHQPPGFEIWINCHYLIGQKAQADSLWHLGRKIARENKDLEFETQLFINRAGQLWDEDEYDRALSYLDSAYARARPINDLFQMQRIIGLRGKIAYMSDDYAEAAALYAEAISLATRICAEEDLASLYLNYGQPLYELGRFDEALRAYAEGEAVASRANNEERRIDFMISKAEVYAYLNQREVAEIILREAQALALQQNYLGSSRRAKVNLADLRFLEGKYEQARSAYKKFIGYLDQTQNRFERHNYIARIADTYKADKDFGRAKTWYAKARQEAARQSQYYEALYLLELADLEVIAGKPEAAMTKYAAVLETAIKQESADLLARVHESRGDAYKSAGEVNRAIAAYQKAGVIIEETRQKLRGDPLRVSYYSGKARVYGKLARVFLQRFEERKELADLDSLFYCTQLMQARSLYDLRVHKDLPGDQSEATHHQEYQRACDELQSIQRRLRKAPYEEQRLRTQLEVARSSLLAQRLQLVEHQAAGPHALPASARALQTMQLDLQQAGLGLLLYHISEDTSFALAATGDTLKVIGLQFSPAALASALDSLMAPLHNVKEESIPYVSFNAALAHRLYLWLIKPIEEMITLSPRIMLVPDLELTGLPFELLLVKPQDQPVYTPSDHPAYADDFLVHRYTITYSPAVWLLQERSTEVAANPAISVFANPFGESSKLHSAQARSRRGWRFYPLPYTELEASEIQTIYPRARVYLRNEATETKFRHEASHQDVMHIASHAFVDTIFDAFSGLVLAAGDSATDDGFLMGYEIADLSLPCDLIVLSACETGVGRKIAGEGVLGLPRLFLGAGAKSVLMTLWQVHDEFASALMPRFYELFREDGLSKAGALAHAKRGVLRHQNAERKIHYQHPFFWACFVLYGDPGVRRGPDSRPVPLYVLVAAIGVLILSVSVYVLSRKKNSASR